MIMLTKQNYLCKYAGNTVSIKFFPIFSFDWQLFRYCNMAYLILKCNISLQCSRLSMVGMAQDNNNNHIQENHKMSVVGCSSKAFSIWHHACNILQHCSGSVLLDKDSPRNNKRSWDSHKTSSHLWKKRWRTTEWLQIVVTPSRERKATDDNIKNSPAPIFRSYAVPGCAKVVGSPLVSINQTDMGSF
mgnify:CR=1 FL=1